MKSTIAAAVGITLVVAGFSVLAVDLDPEHRDRGASLATWLEERRPITHAASRCAATDRTAPLFQSILERPKKPKRKKASELDAEEPKPDGDESGPKTEEQSQPNNTKKKIMRVLSDKRLTRGKAWEMVQRRGKKSGIKTEICNHTFRGTGITAYLENGGTREKARQMAAHSSTRTTQLYDRRDDRVTLDEVVKINIKG